ncbi:MULTISPECIES: hypothetical protein [unclassified Gilliamella]|uniref:hypothetical protein n=1 Tax=unclassified Gilliamella TaxID=2685620 RepID=UPI00130B4AF2|nr:MULTISPECIES: hypothetical protein [unclassified Gilliamella]MWP50013.1 hypothetical protein [Gilliamella sp. Lep-s35]MWP69697.1 hypothetical protein [Gilliamella sp. Lep-s5]MWP78008.1 hypothetical protein [Gilliamella sp. Lep-s21]
MCIKTSLNIIEEKLIGENSIPIKIHVGSGVDEDDYLLLRKAILHAIEYYQDKKEVPKKLALAFVNISNYFFISKDSPYSEKEMIMIENIGNELSELGEKLFS